MLERLLDALAVTVTRRRAAVLAAVGVFVAFCASQLPSLQTDSSPENLIISFGGYQERVADFHRYFGDTDSVVVLLVQAEDATQLEPLRYVHRLSRHFATDPHVVRVESLTVTPLPGAEPAPSATLDDLGSLDDLEAEGEGEPVDPRFQSALETLIASDPERFPMGLYTVADRVGDGESDVRGVVRGDDVTEEEAAAIRAAIEDVPLAQGRLVSRDRTLAAVVLFLDPALGTGQARLEAVHEMSEWLAANPPPEPIQLHPAGIPHLRAAISDHMIEDQTILVPLSLLVCVVLLLLSFRWVPGVVLTLGIVGFTVVCTLGLMAFVGEPMTILMNTLPTLLIIMGISESVHFLGRYVEEARRTTDKIAAARRTVRQLAIACFLTSFTTAVGFGALIVAQTDMLRRFGMVASLGVMLSYVLVMTMVPAALTYMAAPRHAKNENAPRGWLEGLMVASTAWVLRHRWPLVIAIGLAMIPCAWTYSQLRVDTALRDTFDPNDPVVVSTRLIDERLDGIRPLEVLIEVDREGALRDPEVLARLDRIARWAQSQDGVLRATSATDFLWEAWRRIAGIGRDEPHEPFRSREQVDALITLMGRLEHSPVENFLTPDGRHARIEIRLGDVGAQRSIRLIGAVEERVHQELEGIEGVRVAMLGEAFIGSHGTDAVIQDMFGALSLSAFLSFLTIGLLFRSTRLGLLAIPPNTIPQTVTLAWMYLRGIPLTASTAIVFSVAIGITVDLTIHSFARLIEEEERGLLRRAAILRSARGTGRSIVVSCATLVCGFGVLLLSGFVPVRHFGELIAVALGAALFATLVFQPAMLSIFGGKPRGKRAARPIPASERAHP